MGWLIFSLGKMTFSVPILAFFVSSSLLSKAGKSKKDVLSGYVQKGSRRDARQVLANGLIPTILLLLWHQSQNSTFAALYFVSLASATSDTWATEIGLLSKRSPRSLLHFKEVPKGASGGVTLLGLSGALAGALMIASTVVLSDFSTPSLDVSYKVILIITTSGLIAQTVDSLLGVSFQVKYCCPRCGETIERQTHCTHVKAVRESGWPWLDNDMVNLLSILGGVVFGWIGLEIF